MSGIEIGYAVALILEAIIDAALANIGYILAYVVVAAASYFLTADGDIPSFDTASDAGIKVSTRSTQEPLKLIYGTLETGGNDVFLTASGNDDRRLWIVQTLSEGECEGLAQNGESQDEVYLSDKHYTEYDGKLVYYFHSGAIDQVVDADLASDYPEWTDCLRNTCYIVWQLWHDINYFQGFPSRRTVILNGIKLYDFRTSTTAWSDNPVLAIYDFMTNARYGMGYAAAKFDITSWTSAANYCYAKGFTVNMCIKREDSAQSILDKILALFRGQINWYDGIFYMHYSDLNYESSVMTITDLHILQDERGKASVKMSQPSQFGKADGLTVRWNNPDAGYIIDSIPIGDEEGVINELDMTHCTNREQACNLGVYTLERSNMDRAISGTYRANCIKLEPGDVITYNSSALNIADQLMRVQTANINTDGTIYMALAYEDEDLYNDDYDIGSEGLYEVDLPDWMEDPPPVENLALTEAQFDYRLRTFTKIGVSFDAPTNYAWFSHVEVYLSYDNATWLHMFNASEDFEIPVAEEGVTYYIRLKTVSIYGSKTLDDDDDAKASITVQGYISTPASLTSLEAVVNENTINLYAAKVTDPDVELYEFRLGTAWSGGVFLGAYRSPNLSLTGVKPGTHTFYCNTLSNNGEYGANPQFKTVSIIDPPDGWSLQDTETCDYDGVGTHDNTEHTTYTSEDYLKCSHTADVLDGTYESPIYDLGASDRYMVYLLAQIVVTGTGTTWDAQVPDPTTWEDVGADTKTWLQIFEPSAAPAVRIKLKYGDTTPPANEVGMMEILSAIVTGQYFQIIIDIEDPTLEINALIENFTLKFCQQ